MQSGQGGVGCNSDGLRGIFGWQWRWFDVFLRQRWLLVMPLWPVWCRSFIRVLIAEKLNTNLRASSYCWPSLQLETIGNLAELLLLDVLIASFGFIVIVSDENKLIPLSVFMLPHFWFLRIFESGNDFDVRMKLWAANESNFIFVSWHFNCTLTRSGNSDCFVKFSPLELRISWWQVSWWAMGSHVRPNTRNMLI